MMLLSMAIPLIFIIPFVMGMAHKRDPYTSLSLGARDGVSAMLRIFPALVILLSAIGAFVSSGAQQYLITAVTPILEVLGIPPQTAPLILTRPFSGSAALAVGSDIMSQYGPDSFIGRTCAVMLGSTETTFYTLAVYMSASSVRVPKKTVLCALIGDFVGFAAAPLCVRIFFGK